MALLEIENLTVEFPTRRQTFVAVDSANLTVEPGQIHGLVGESGAGKSTIGAAVMGLLERPGRIASGIIRFRGDEISGLDAAAMEKLRGKKISMIFQDPLTSLNPLHREAAAGGDDPGASGRAMPRRSKRAVDLIDGSAFPNPDVQRANQYPHQFSGGMRQRVVIALALCFGA
jgi:peptide/nickel transport system ATP-binding protein